MYLLEHLNTLCLLSLNSSYFKQKAIILVEKQFVLTSVPISV